MKRILVVYATAGIGHAKAAMAVKKALDELNPEAEVRLIDSLNYTTSFFRASYLGGYLILVNRFSDCWGFFYHVINNYYVNMIVSKVRRYVNWLHSRRLVDFLLDFRPDVVISTHFLATEVVSQLKKKGLTGAKLVNVVTDYRVHAFWVAPYADAYMVASEDTKMDLIRWRVDPSKINVTGIPVEPKFPREVEDGKIGLRAKLGLKEDIFTVLVVGGGFGMGPIERIVRILDELKTPLQAVVICGYNQKLKTRMIRLKGVVKVELREFGFVENMHEFMAASDILISKSGGITVTEALVMRLPMVVVSPIPGQETKNALFLVRHNAAMMVSSLEELAAALKPIINNRERLDRMRANIELIRHPSAAFDIASFAIGMDSDG